MSATTLKIRWDTTDPSNPGWYVEAVDGDGNFVDDSMKVGFPVDVDDFGPDDEDGLIAALETAFPGAEVAP